MATLPIWGPVLLTQPCVLSPPPPPSLPPAPPTPPPPVFVSAGQDEAAAPLPHSRDEDQQGQRRQIELNKQRERRREHRHVKKGQYLMLPLISSVLVKTPAFAVRLASEGSSVRVEWRSDWSRSPRNRRAGTLELMDSRLDQRSGGFEREAVDQRQRLKRGGKKKSCYLLF